MKIRLATLHCKRSFIPLSLLYLKAFLVQQSGHAAGDVEILEFNRDSRPDDMVRALVDGAPEVIGLAIYVWNVTTLIAVAKRVKEQRPQTTIVLGGPEVGPLAAAVLAAHPYIDAVVKSEGELPLAAIVDSVRHGRDLAGVPGIAFRRGPEVVDTGGRTDPAGSQRAVVAARGRLHRSDGPHHLHRDAARLRVPVQLLLLQQGPLDPEPAVRPRSRQGRDSLLAAAGRRRDLVLPGTELWRKAEALRLDFDPAPPYFARSHFSMTADDIVYGRKIADAVDLLGNAKTIRFLCKEPHVTFAEVLDAWIAWQEAQPHGTTIGVRIRQFLSDFCARKNVPAAFYVGFASLEFASVRVSSGEQGDHAAM